MSFTRPQSCSVWGQENSVYLIKMGVLSGGARRPGLLLPFSGVFLGVWRAIGFHRQMELLPMFFLSPVTGLPASNYRVPVSLVLELG